jgi:nitrile hydratase subunit beta
MNGVHDMGGMHGMGPIQREQDEPVFHERWEARTFALTLAMAAWRKWTLDGTRHQRERIPGAEYLRMSYYEKWFGALVELLIKSGLVTVVEVETGKPEPSPTRTIPPLTPDKVLPLVRRGNPASREAVVASRFHVGQLVRARNIHPIAHTRLPRYARGKLGKIDKDHGVFVFPDTNAHSLGENPQHVYSVRFAASELWGEQAASRDAVYIDMWDAYLEPA